MWFACAVDRLQRGREHTKAVAGFQLQHSGDWTWNCLPGNRNFLCRHGHEKLLCITGHVHCMVSEAGALAYSVSPGAGKQMPGLDYNLRSAVSIARCIDPLAELVKIG